jgi:hypothetical protein
MGCPPLHIQYIVNMQLKTGTKIEAWAQTMTVRTVQKVVLPNTKEA